MTASLPDPVLTLYTRERCELCAEIRDALQAALEDRATRGAAVPSVREVDVTSSPGLAERYGALVPVLELAGQELPLAMSGRQVRSFLDRALPVRV
jgi:hypothetical protein